MIISVINQKGGVGKTTITLNLGVALARLNQRVLLIDIDPQASLSTFTALSEPNLQLQTTSPDKLAATLKKARFDCALIDCPPYLGQEAAAALKLSQLAIAPTPPRFLDVAGFALLRQTVQQAAERGNPQLTLKLLLSLRDARATVHRDYEENLRSAFGPALFKAAIPRTILVDRAADAHTSVFQIDSRAAVTQAFRDLAREVLALGT